MGTPVAVPDDHRCFPARQTSGDAVAYRRRAAGAGAGGEVVGAAGSVAPRGEPSLTLNIQMDHKRAVRTRRDESAQLADRLFAAGNAGERHRACCLLPLPQADVQCCAVSAQQCRCGGSVLRGRGQSRPRGRCPADRGRPRRRPRPETPADRSPCSASTRGRRSPCATGRSQFLPHLPSRVPRRRASWWWWRRWPQRSASCCTPPPQ